MAALQEQVVVVEEKSLRELANVEFRISNAFIATYKMEITISSNFHFVFIRNSSNS